MKNPYPRATQGRVRSYEPIMKKARRGFFKAAGKNFTMLQLLFLGLCAYAFGALFQQTTRIHNMAIVFVDYDGGTIGQAVRAAYSNRLRGDGFPALQERSAADFASPEKLEAAVCRTDYWAAIYVAPGASDRLQAVLAGNASASGYDPSNVMVQIWNQARYSTVVDSTISASLQTLSAAARVAYSTANGTGAIQRLASPGAVSVFVNPWDLRSVNIQPTAQGSRSIYNTLVIILILVQEFFYLGTVNGLYVQFKVYTIAQPWMICVFRNLLSLAYTFVGSLCTAGAIWAFRHGWPVSQGQMVLTWMALWLFAHLNFLILDIFTVWLPGPYVPMSLVTWLILNVTSILLPLELSPAFYRVGHAIPAYNVYQVLVNIWSRGCNPAMDYALPVLFAWEVLGLALSALGVYRRCHYASIAQEEQEEQFRERLENAVASEKKREAEEQAQTQATAEECQLSREDGRMIRERKRASLACSFGPSFNLVFGEDSESDSNSDRTVED